MNAGIRTGHGELSAQLLVEDDKKVVKKIVKQLKELKEIQNVQKDKLVEKLEIEITQKGLEGQKVMGFLVDSKSDMDIVGLVCNVISANHDCLVIIVHPTNEEGIYKGSIRGNYIPNFRQLILNSGLSIFCAGHNAAAGIGVKKSNWQKLIDELNDDLQDTDLQITSNADIILKPKDLTTNLIKKIEYVNMISGTGFKPISIVIQGLEPIDISTMKDIHSKFISEGIEFIQWHSSLADELQCDIGIYKTIDVLFTPCIGNFRGIKSRQGIISDYRIESHLEFFR